MRKRMLSLFMALVMVIGLVPFTGIHASAAAAKLYTTECNISLAAGDIVKAGALCNCDSGNFHKVILYNTDFYSNGNTIPFSINGVSSDYWEVVEIVGNTVGNHMYYVQAISAPTYQVTWKDNDGKTLKTTTVNYDKTPSYGETPTKPSTSQYSYTFSHWNPAPSAKSISNGTPISNVTASVTYTAIFNKTARSYNVTLNTNGGTINSGNVTTYTYGNGAALPTPSKVGYQFDGWYTDAACTSTKITAIGTTETGDKTYYAKWTPIPYAITLQNGGNMTGGKFSVDKSTATINETVTITVNPKLGYLIEGVYVDGSKLTEANNTYSFTMPARNVDVSVAFNFDFQEIADELTLLRNADTELDAAIEALKNAKADTATLNDKVTDLLTAIEAAETAAKAYTDAENTELKTELEGKIATAKSEAASAAETLVNNAKAELQNVIDTKADTTALNEAINKLQSALETAQSTLEAADAANKAALEGQIAAAQTTLKAAIDAVQENLNNAITNMEKNLSDAVAELNTAIANGDTRLDGKIDALNAALDKAKNELLQADADNKAALQQQIADAQTALNAAIDKVQQNLDTAVGKLKEAITDGNDVLDSKISEVNSALASAKAALEQADAENKLALETKISEAETTLQAAIDQVQTNLDNATVTLTEAMESGDAELNDRITDTKSELSTALRKGDAALSNMIDNLDTDLVNAKYALQKSDAENKAEIMALIEAVDSTLDAKILKLDKALTDAKAVIAQADEDSRITLEEKIDEADKILSKALIEVQKDLQATKEKVNLLQKLITAAITLALLTFCVTVGFIIWFFLDRKRVNASRFARK